MNSHSSQSPIYIGEAAKLTGLTIKSIRFYEDKGLIPTPKRLGRYRVYNASDLEILTLIKEAKSLGIRIAQLQKMIRYQQDGKVDWQRIKVFLKEIRQAMKDEIIELNKKIASINLCIEQIDS